MNKFKCQQCGACCTAVPIHIDIYNKFKDKLSVYAKVINITDTIVTVWSSDTNARCGFLNPFNNCVIYNDRPQICKSYGDKHGLQCVNQFNNTFNVKHLKQVSAIENDLIMEGR